MAGLPDGDSPSPQRSAIKHPLRTYYAEVLRMFIDEPLLRAVVAASAVVLAIGTAFYHFAEDWSWLNSLYFCVITLTTIGYGDLAPTSPLTRAFTIGYVVVGVGIITLFITAVTRAPMLRDQLRHLREEAASERNDRA